MNLFNDFHNNENNGLVNSILDDDIDDILYQLVLGKTQNNDTFQPPEDTKENEMEQNDENKKNTHREYIRLPDARIKKRKHQQGLIKNEPNNATSILAIDNRGKKRVRK